MEHALYRGIEKENGFVFFQDIKLSPQKHELDIIARFATFSTDSYNSRIYAYENGKKYDASFRR